MGMGKRALLLRLMLGGLVVGFLVGSIAGAIMGIVVRWNLGLDGSLLGGALLGALGAGYGLVAGWLDSRGKTAAPAGPESAPPANGSEVRPQANHLQEPRPPHFGFEELVG